MKGAGVLLGIVVVVAGTLAVPVAWVQGGPFPDLAVLAVVYAACSGTPERATAFGIAIGFALCPFGPEPLGQQALLLGGLGWLVARLNRNLYRERIGTQMAVAFLAVMVLRLASAGMAETSLAREAALAARSGGIAWASERGATASPGSLHGYRLGSLFSGTLAGALGTAAAVLPVFAILDRTGLLGALESRAWRRARSAGV